MKRLDDFLYKYRVPYNIIALWIWVTNIDTEYGITWNWIPILFIIYHAKQLWNAFNE